MKVKNIIHGPARDDSGVFGWLAFFFPDEAVFSSCYSRNVIPAGHRGRAYLLLLG